ncbi:MAG TPA: hypothetical protein DEA90_01840 [Opitutae bacterium]|nr:hypothetical protein [Puniceicoccaceae bacterium]HBR92886.1 hypothetical protein [Opitutae bacterium]|tara:strand:- start:56 stop:484 length:429 start_codon:yes stop_codon:yes gene_type:complete
MKYLILALACFFLAGCEKEQSAEKEQSVKIGGFNSLVDTKIEVIEKEGEIYYELTLEQKIDPKAPAYVTNLRELKWINKLSYGLQTQIIGEDVVISVFHIKPLPPMDSIVLKRDDFEWYPKISGFAPITIETKGSNQSGDGQ